MGAKPKIVGANGRVEAVRFVMTKFFAQFVILRSLEVRIIYYREG